MILNDSNKTKTVDELCSIYSNALITTNLVKEGNFLILSNYLLTKELESFDNNNLMGK